MAKQSERAICDGCGAPLKDTGSTQCDYCGVLIRVTGRDSEQYNVVNIVNQIIELSSTHAEVHHNTVNNNMVSRGQGFEDMYERTKILVEQNKFVEASRVLDNILDKDIRQPRAWFYKALLPILDKEEVVYKGCLVNVRVISKITDRRLIREYLKHCGLPWYHHRGFMEFYGSTDFLYEQYLKYTARAIEYSTSKEQKEFFENHKKQMAKRHKSRQTRIFVGNLFLTVLLAGAIIFGALFISGAILR